MYLYSAVVIVIFGIGGSVCQDENEEKTTEEIPAICKICACAEGVVDCDKRNLIEPFTDEEWNALEKTDLREVRMSGNSLEILTVFPEMPIRTLNVSDSKIDGIEDECFRFLPDLVTLDLSRNHIMTLSKRVFWGLLLPDATFRSFVKMKWLSLAHNELHSLPKDAFGYMHDLTFLDLSGNPLGVIDQLVMGSLSDLIYLKELRLSGCELDSLPVGLFRRQRRLQRLDISNNKFKVMPSVLNEAVNLVYLNFDRNNIVTLTKEDASLSNLHNLQELSICYNTKLQSIGPGSLAGLESLVSLSICNNPRLGTIDDDFLTWVDDHEISRRPTLRELNLNHNRLTEIDSDFLHRWDQLQKMDFSENPFVCDCKSQWMLDVLVPYLIKVNGSASDMICNKPPEMRGLSFEHLYQNSRTLPCPSEGVTQAPGPSTAVVLGVMIGVFATFPLVILVVLLWKKGYFAKCRRKMNNEDSEDEEGAF